MSRQGEGTGQELHVEIDVAAEYISEVSMEDVETQVERRIPVSCSDGNGLRDPLLSAESRKNDTVAEVPEAELLNESCRRPDEDKEPLLPLHSASQQSLVEDTKVPQNSESKERLSSLDVFRGLTILAMIVVDYAGGLWSPLNHSPWNGVTFADFVMPAFLFIVGVSLALTLKDVVGTRIVAWKIFLRVLKLIFLGLVLQGGYFHGIDDLAYGVSIEVMRIMGILQRIALAYAIVAIFEVISKQNSIIDAKESFVGLLKIYYLHWIVVFVLSSIYMGLLYGIYVPNWQFEAPSPINIAYGNTSSTLGGSLLNVKCNVRGDLGPACNAVGFVDRSVLGISHLYQQPSYRRTKECSVDSPNSGPLPADAPVWCLAPFDPEGLLSSVMAVVTCFIGAHYGHILVHFKGHQVRLWQWTWSAFVLLIIGMLLDLIGLPLNKNLYSLSYTSITTGAVALVFCACYVLVDVYGWRRSTFLFKWMGMNSLALYALAACGVFPAAVQGFYWNSQQNNLVSDLMAWTLDPNRNLWRVQFVKATEQDVFYINFLAAIIASGNCKVEENVPQIDLF